MGFVPAKADSVVVLLCRVCVEGAPGLKVQHCGGTNFWRREVRAIVHALFRRRRLVVCARSARREFQATQPWCVCVCMWSETAAVACFPRERYFVDGAVSDPENCCECLVLCNIFAGHGLGPLGVATAGPGQAILALARQGAFGTAAGTSRPAYVPRLLAVGAYPCSCLSFTRLSVLTMVEIECFAAACLHGFYETL